MIVINGTFILIIFPIHFSNVAIRFIADNYKHLSRLRRFDGLRKLLDFPLFAGFSVRSPVVWLDAVEEDSSILYEFPFSRKSSIILRLELPVDVEGLPIVIIKLIWVCSVCPVSIENPIIVYG